MPQLLLDLRTHSRPEAKTALVGLSASGAVSTKGSDFSGFFWDSADVADGETTPEMVEAQADEGANRLGEDGLQESDAEDQEVGSDRADAAQHFLSADLMPETLPRAEVLDEYSADKILPKRQDLLVSPPDFRGVGLDRAKSDLQRLPDAAAPVAPSVLLGPKLSAQTAMNVDFSASRTALFEVSGQDQPASMDGVFQVAEVASGESALEVSGVIGSAAARVAGQPLPAGMVMQTKPPPIHHQLSDTILRMRGYVTELTLSPEELGRVRITISRSADGLLISLVADRPQALELLKENAAVLQQEMAEAGEDMAQLSFDAFGEGAEDHASDQAAEDVIMLMPEPEAHAAYMPLTGRLDIRI